MRKEIVLKLILTSLLCCGLLIPVYSQTVEGKDTFSREDFSVYLEDAEERIIVGEPLAQYTGTLNTYFTSSVIINDIQLGPTEWDLVEYAQEGIVIKHYRGWPEIMLIRITSDKFATYRGIKVGDSLEKVLCLYGGDPEAEISVREEYISYSVEITDEGKLLKPSGTVGGGLLEIIFDLLDGVIDEIWIQTSEIW
ncbi:MAG: hypothetical protein KAU17_13515 [Spirochaetales bacterium]|nr:hypothetical protein [Spirochaetales bacterium]